MSMPFTHLDASGSARMVDVTAKQPTVRAATASGKVMVAPEVIALLRDGGVPFDPFGHADPEAPRSVEETPIGGLGIMMVKRLMDAHSYRYVDGCNEVTIAKCW